MLTLLLFLTLFVPDADAIALQKTAPSYLTVESAREHIAAARFAASVHAVDPDLLLSLAYFESRYRVDTVGPTVRGKRACGVLQPTMEIACDEAPTLLGGYLKGARHVREWIDAARGDMTKAMLGYAGGYSLIDGCAAGEVLVERGGRQVDLCTVVGARLNRVKRIQHARARAAS